MQPPSSSFRRGPLNVLLAFLICSSFSILFQSQKPEAARAIASLSSCKRKCGNTTIPYPFGMKKGCYLDETFAVTCNESAGSASLADFVGEVDSISTSSHTLRFNGFYALALEFNKSGESAYGHSFNYNNLGDHYTLSHTRNKYVVKGCDVYAYLVDNVTKELIGGCAPLCNRTDIAPSRSSSCSGLDCSSKQCSSLVCSAA